MVKQECRQHSSEAKNMFFGCSAPFFLQNRSILFISGALWRDLRLKGPVDSHKRGQNHVFLAVVPRACVLSDIIKSLLTSKLVVDFFIFHHAPYPKCRHSQPKVAHCRGIRRMC